MCVCEAEADKARWWRTTKGQWPLLAQTGKLSFPKCAVLKHMTRVERRTERSGVCLAKPFPAVLQNAAAGGSPMLLP